MKGIHCSECDTINAWPVDNCAECGHVLDASEVRNFCDFPECDRDAVKKDIYCKFHRLLNQQRLGAKVDDRELEAAFMEG